MIPYQALEQLKNEMGKTPYADRIVSELHFAANLSLAHNGKYDAVVTEAIHTLEKAVREECVITKTAAIEAEKILLPLQADAKKYRIHCVAHAHIDMNWMWGFQETVSVTVDTFRTVLNLMKEYPELTFAQSQASTYEIIEKYAPSMLPEIRERVKEGRWEVSASTWVETDKNMPAGESLARHILYTKRYL
jgi:alpha-mannosidase